MYAHQGPNEEDRKGKGGDRTERRSHLELFGPGDWAHWKDVEDVGVGDTRGNGSRGQSCWRWDGEFGPL